MPDQPDATFDSNMEICYEILLYLSSRLARLAPGDVFAFTSGDPEAPEKIPAWCEARGYTLLESTTLPDGRARFLLRREPPGSEGGLL